MALVVLCVAGVSLWLSVPRLVASLQKAPAHFTLLAAYWDHSLTSGELAGAAGQLEKARRWEDSADLNSELGFLLLLQAYQSETTEQRQKVAARAASVLEQSLLLSPSRPQPWVRLGFARYFLDREPSEITAPIEQSVTAGPYVGEIAITRLKLLLLTWDQLPPSLKDYTYEQIRYSWPNAAGQILEIAQLTDHPEVIRFALQELPDAVEQLDRVLSAG